LKFEPLETVTEMTAECSDSDRGGPAVSDSYGRRDLTVTVTDSDMASVTVMVMAAGPNGAGWSESGTVTRVVRASGTVTTD
jgi:hypothetical protein